MIAKAQTVVMPIPPLTSDLLLISNQFRSFIACGPWHA